MLPANEWWGILRAYGAAVWPAQALFIALGRPWEKTLVPGTFPCPTTALAPVLLAKSLPRVDKFLYTLLLFRAIPFAPFIQIPRYTLYEDIIMFGVGIYALVMLVGNRKVRAVATVSNT